MGQRTSSGRGRARKLNRRMGASGLGWTRSISRDVDGRRIIVEVPDEVETVARILELRSRGATLRGVAAILTLEGRNTKRGGRWYASTVWEVLRAHDALDEAPVVARSGRR